MNKAIKEMFSEDDGTASFSRVATGLLVMTAIAWISVIVHKTHGLPDNISGLSVFIGTLYGVNRAHAVGMGFAQK